MPDEELAGFLRACVYNGNLDVLEKLYDLMPEEEESRQVLELAASRVAGLDSPLSDTNPYRPEIFYGDSSRKFPQADTLALLAEGLQSGKTPEELGAEVVEPNYDLESVYQLMEMNDSDGRAIAVYRLDLNGDGKQEILIVNPGGSMGNLFWEVLYLDGSGKVIRDESGKMTEEDQERTEKRDSGEGMQQLTLYRYKGNYFFTTNIIDLTDKEFCGWEVCAMDRLGEIHLANVLRSKTGSEIVFTDEYNKNDLFYYLDWDLDGFINLYKSYDYCALGKETEPEREMSELFQDGEKLSGLYGTIDFNNDGIEDWTKVYMFFPSNRLPYYCNYWLADGRKESVPVRVRRRRQLCLEAD